MRVKIFEGQKAEVEFDINAFLRATPASQKTFGQFQLAVSRQADDDHNCEVVVLIGYEEIFK